MTENILNRLKRHYASGCKLLSNQKDRELLSVAAFLEIAGVGFEAVQLEYTVQIPHFLKSGDLSLS